MRPHLAPACAALLAIVASAAAVDFETPADEPPGASLPSDKVAGEGFSIQDPVHSDGLMHRYVVESRYGSFAAYGREALEVRLREVAALHAIARQSDVNVVFKAATRGMESDAKSMLRVATNPVGTVLGIPKGIGHLLSGYRAQAQEVTAEAGKTLKGTSKSSAAAPAENLAARAASQSEHFAKQYADRYLGLSAAERRWYEKLGVDPYTDNVVLRHAVTRISRVDAAASFGMRFAPIGIPFAGEVGRALDAIYKEDPAVLRKRRHEALASYGLAAAEIESFENALLLSPTRQTLLVDAVKALEGVEGRAELLRHATAVISEDEVDVFVRSAQLLVRYHAQQPVTRILPGLRLPAAQRADGHVIVLGAFDAIQWTEAVAGYERGIRAALPQDASGRELRVTGSVSARARGALEELGWSVHERAD